MIYFAFPMHDAGYMMQDRILCKELVGAGPCACPDIIGQPQGVAPTILWLSSCASWSSLRVLRGSKLRISDLPSCIMDPAS